MFSKGRYYTGGGKEEGKKRRGKMTREEVGALEEDEDTWEDAVENSAWKTGVVVDIDEEGRR